MSLDLTLTPPACPCCGNISHGGETFNITHNLNKMAQALGIYKILWRPEENGIALASQLIEPLRKAILKMENHPNYYRKFGDPEGWGTYSDFLPWLKNLLSYCERVPNATVFASR